MSNISSFLRKLVIRRADNRCEYCQLSQKGQEATFHIDHIIPLASNGTTTPENLALACVSCSLKKGAKQFVIGENKAQIRLFHPRIDKWDDHFEWKGIYLHAKTDIGNTMIRLLDLNRAFILAIREEEIYLQRHPLKK